MNNTETIVRNYFFIFDECTVITSTHLVRLLSKGTAKGVVLSLTLEVNILNSKGRPASVFSQLQGWGLFSFLHTGIILFKCFAEIIGSNISRLRLTKHQASASIQHSNQTTVNYMLPEALLTLLCAEKHCQFLSI